MTAIQRNIITTVVVVCLFMGGVVALFAYQMSKPRIMTVEELVNNGAITFEAPRPIKDFSLIAHTGEPFTRDNLQGRWTVLFFGFSHCGGFCPATLALLNSFYHQLEPEIRADTQIVMVTVDPARDTSNVLADYTAKFNQDFVGVTGEFLQIRLLSDQFHIGIKKSVGGEEDYHVQHGEQLILLNPAGEYQGFFKPPFTLAQLKATYQSIILSHQ